VKLLLIGNFQRGHVGHSLRDAARRLHVETLTLDTREASATARWLVRVNWHLRGHRPALLGRFSAKVVQACRGFEPDVLLSTGCAPLQAGAIRLIRKQGVTCANYSTDDPWSVSHRSSWFLGALREYSVVYSPRLSNLQQLRELDGPMVEYLPFGYDPAIYHPEELEAEEASRLASDVLFVGGGDRDRLPFIEHLIQQNFDLALYGGYWQRDKRVRTVARGLATPDTIRKATQAAKVNLCLVRRANRDGHVMRSFECAAMGACMLVEDTAEHRQIFGAEGEAVLYFGTIPEMTTKLSWLLEHPEKRGALGRAAMLRITGDQNSYQDRLVTILGMKMRGSGCAA
jgi:spore maturation protein CgeB